MSQFRRRRHQVAGFILGLVPAATASAQGLPPVFPPSADPAAPPVASNGVGSPIFRPIPPVVLVPPEGAGPIWNKQPIDPIALEKLDSHPGFFHKKLHSWHWHRAQGRFYGYPEEFQPRPLGAALYENGKVMVANAAQARLVLFRYDFIEGTAELSPRGMDQLIKFSAQLAVSPYPLIIERTIGDPGLADARRFAVLAKLAQTPYPLMSDRVLVGVPIPNGMTGSDAQIIAGNGLSRTQNYGPVIPLLSNGVNSPSSVTGGGGGGNGNGNTP
jgi:hypothetical protein